VTADYRLPCSVTVPPASTYVPAIPGSSRVTKWPSHVYDAEHRRLRSNCWQLLSFETFSAPSLEAAPHPRAASWGHRLDCHTADALCLQDGIGVRSEIAAAAAALARRAVSGGCEARAGGDNAGRLGLLFHESSYANGRRRLVSEGTFGNRNHLKYVLQENKL
jgi:hypothetical protein